MSDPPSVVFSFWRFVVQVGWVPSLSWFDDTKRGTRVYHVVGFAIVDMMPHRAARFILGPITMTLGFVTAGKRAAGESR